MKAAGYRPVGGGRYNGEARHQGRRRACVAWHAHGAALSANASRRVGRAATMSRYISMAAGLMADI